MKNLFPLIILFLNFSLNAQDVTIGTQTWQTKNLNVSKYRNGDVIPQVQDAAAWAKLTTGAWCYYQNKTENGTKYGKLYNWYAVSDPRGLAPLGYHIPNEGEMETLINYLGGEEAAGPKMKSKSGWLEYGNGNNSSGFSGLPGGCRNSTGNFTVMGKHGNWWSSSAHKGGRLTNNFNIPFYSDWEMGYSVRCLKD